jgi:hypothetical protein
MEKLLKSSKILQAKNAKRFPLGLRQLEIYKKVPPNAAAPPFPD